MTKAIAKLVISFAITLCIFLLGKALFLSMNSSFFSGVGVTDILGIYGHGLTMDMAMSAYLNFIPGVLIAIALFSGNSKTTDSLLLIYYIFISALMSMVILLDSTLYTYWQFKLDSTPFFYFFSSPSSALASATIWHILGLVVVWIALTVFFFWAYRTWVVWLGAQRNKRSFRRPKQPTATRVWHGFVMLLITAMLVIPARGGVSVSTMNLSHAYYSSNTRLNHAAVNPAFSLAYSLAHQNDLSRQFHYMDNDEAMRLFSLMNAPVEKHKAVNDTLAPAAPDPLLLNKRPDVYIILLESFSSHLFPSLGGAKVATGLDSIAESGLLFTNFYASSFRTDRALPAILSGYPGQPTTSIMKFVEKTDQLPSLAAALKNQGAYDTEYYYGGDINFTNMKAYLVSSGFNKIISDKDFPVTERLSKWGAHDHVLFAKTLNDLTPYSEIKPKLRVIQTSSSHEPFKVPYHGRPDLADQRARAFAYTDSCATAFVNELSKKDDWNNSIVIIMPDHYGAWPDMTDVSDRHKIPMIITGGALGRRGTVNYPASQNDLTATLLGAMNLDATAFPFSHDILHPTTHHYAFFSDPDHMGLITEDGEVVVNLETNTLEKGDSHLLPYARSFIQTLYNDLSKR